MIKAVLFDADGVIINSTQRFSSLLEKNYSISTQTTAPFFNGIFQECVIGKTDLKEEVAKFLPRWGWKQSVDDFLLIWFESEHKIHQPLIDEVKKLKNLGIKCFLVTDNEKYRTKYITQNMQLENIFDAVFSSSDIGHRKHNPKFYDSVLEQLPSIKPPEIILWDDDMENINTARQIGLQAEFYNSFEDFKQKMEKYLKHE